MRDRHPRNCSMKIASHSHGHVSAVYTMPGQFMGILELEITKGELHAGEENYERNNRTKNANKMRKLFPMVDSRDIKLQPNL